MTTGTLSASGGSEPHRRDFLILATGAMGVVDAAALTWPFIDQMNPAADALSATTLEVDLSAMERGQRITVNGVESRCLSTGGPMRRSRRRGPTTRRH